MVGDRELSGVTREYGGRRRGGGGRQGQDHVSHKLLEQTPVGRSPVGLCGLGQEILGG